MFPISLDQLVVLPISIVAFVALLSIIVFFHEYGHFSAARWLGVRVDVFSIGFGKPIARWVDRKGTEWRIAMLPFGGYVKFFGDETPASTPRDDVVADRDSEANGGRESGGAATTQFPRPGDAPTLTAEERAVCFHYKPVWARALIVAAGPIANFVLATAMFWALLASFGAYEVQPIVGEVVEDSAAAEAGFRPGDRILSVEGRSVAKFDDLQLVTRLAAGDELTFEVRRGEETIVIVATPKRQEIEDPFGNVAYAGVLGLVADPEKAAPVRYGALRALKEAAVNVWEIVSATVKFLGRLILGKEDSRQLGGPIKMAQYAGQSAVSGFSGEGEATFMDRLQVSLANFVNLAAVVSVSIGFLNLLPVPVLDGGHLMYYAIETVTGRPLGATAQAVGFRIGIVLLASFMLFVTWNDISNLLKFNS
ncbi:MAG: RIP metalloprotease RseP [Parvularculaceae bacterium]